MTLTSVTYALVVGVITFFIGVLSGNPIIVFLRRNRVGKRISVYGPESHQVKMGTPTMGGVFIIISILLATVVFNLVERYSMLMPIAIIGSCGVLGAVDDVLTIVGTAREGGLSPRVKFTGLLLIATTAAFGMHFGLDLRSIYIPGLGKYDLGYFYIPIAIFILVGTANAVNITDGLDGLAAGLLAFAFLAYGLIAFLQGQEYLVTFCFTVVGAALGFLWYNAHPAQVFMGDTGSLALGGTLGTVALMTGQWLLLPVVAVVFVGEAASVIIQTAVRRLFNDKRFFKMAPIHHHFELSGWAESKITVRFWIVGLVGALLGTALALI